VALTLAVSLGGACPGPGPSPGPPDPDDCEPAPGGPRALDGLDLGAPEDGSFRAWGGAEVVQPVIGGQGSSMLTLRVRARGSAVPECLPLKIRITRAAQVIGSFETPVKTYSEASGGRASKIIYVVLFGADPLTGDALTVEAESGVATTGRTVHVRELRVDAGTD